ncbi:MAG: PAS domain-containing protein [Blastochloris sp.]|nr:PAS domain-containing protein [Blastochloris sp.]
MFLFILAVVIFLVLWWIYRRQVIKPLRRALGHSRLLAEGKISEGYVVSGIPEIHDLVNDLQKIDQRVRQLSSYMRVEEFSLKTILASMVEGVIVTDTDSVIQMANRAFAQMFRLERDPVKRPLMDVLLQPDIKAIIDQALKTERESSGEVLIEDLLDQQQRRVFQVSASPLGEPGEGPKGVVVVFHDISRIKQLEDLRREFVANVSHELRTPLAIFHGYLETILENAELPTDEVQRVLRVMKRHSDRLNDLVVDLLTLSRLESGQIKMDYVDLNVFPMLERLKADWAGLFEKKKCRLVLSCPVPLPTIEADTLRVEQVFYNLLENALKYSDDGKEIEVGGIHEEGSKYVNFYVKDYGTGIPSDKVDQIFQRFYRVDRARSRDKGGTGLGLAIVKHIVQLHGGKVWAESALGKGTTVWFQMPTSRLELDSVWPGSEDPARQPNSPEVRSL